MNETLALIFGYGIPIGWVLGITLGAIVALIFFIAQPKLFGFLLFLFILNIVFPAYGFRETQLNLYFWGVGKLPFPLIQFYLYGLFIAVWMHNVYMRRQPLMNAGGGWFILFTLLFIGHFVAGLMEDQHWLYILHRHGLINILHMGMSAYIAASLLQNEKDIEKFIKIFLVFAVARAIYGLARFFFFGGDPQNAYSNITELNIKLTYWDTSESLIATIAAFYFAWRLVKDWSTLRTSMRFLFTGCFILEIALILLSFRRAHLFGLALAGMYFLSLLPWRQRIIYTTIAAIFLIPSISLVTAYRAKETIGTRAELTIWEQIAPDALTANITDPESRFYELYRAYDSTRDNLALGVGSWGTFKIRYGDQSALSYHQGDYSFVHSGFGHIFMKSGLLGLLLFCGIFLAAWRFGSKARMNISAELQPAFHAYRSGLWFMVPSLLFATPIIENRTMLWMGILLGLPIAIASRFTKTVPEKCRHNHLAMAIRPSEP